MVAQVAARQIHLWAKFAVQRANKSANFELIPTKIGKQWATPNSLAWALFSCVKGKNKMQLLGSCEFHLWRQIQKAQYAGTIRRVWITNTPISHDYWNTSRLWIHHCVFYRPKPVPMILAGQEETAKLDQRPIQPHFRWEKHFGVLCQFASTCM